MKNKSSIFVLVISLFIIVFIILSFLILNDSYFTNTETSISLVNKNNNNIYDCNVVYEKGDFTFLEAENKCKEKNGRLADIYEMNNAYKSGGHWCNIGWSKDQMGLFPIQKDIWENEKCGKPGLNGQYFSNKNYLFGANCIYN